MCTPKGLDLGRCRRGSGGTVFVVKYHGVDEEDEGTGGGGALVASRKTRALVWLTASVVVGMVATAFLAANDEEKRPRYTKKEGVTLTGIPSNRGGAVRVERTV